jgi:hypothetical protein
METTHSTTYTVRMTEREHRFLLAVLRESSQQVLRTDNSTPEYRSRVRMLVNDLENYTEEKES